MFSNLVILAWTADELWCGQASDWYTHTNKYTDKGDDNTRRPKLASVKITGWAIWYQEVDISTNWDPRRFDVYFRKMESFMLVCHCHPGDHQFIWCVLWTVSQKPLPVWKNVLFALSMICSKLSLLDTDKPLCLSTTFRPALIPGGPSICSSPYQWGNLLHAWS